MMKDKNQVTIDGDDKIRFNPGFFGHSNSSGSWQIYPDASGSVSEGDDFTLVHETEGWTFTFNKNIVINGERKPMTDLISASFVEKV